MDGLDARLLAAAGELTRPNVLELARRLGVARGTAQARLDRLGANGVITGFGPYVDVIIPKFAPVTSDAGLAKFA